MDLVMTEEIFWNKVVASGLLAHNNLIVVGDFNLTMSVGEIWGDSAQPDPLADYFKELFMDVGLVDILPDALAPTWRNGRSGSDNISKRLDRVFVSAEFLNVLVDIGLGLHIHFYRIMHRSYYSWIIVFILQLTRSN
jgi:endonuclease/exonuclease/phosphatase family metal-dependent hydrolase